MMHGQRNIKLSQHVSGIFMPIVRRTDCVPLPMVVCPVVAVVMLESRMTSCVHCVENVACVNKFVCIWLRVKGVSMFPRNVYVIH